MTTGIEAPVPILRFCDNRGNPLVGGSLLCQVGGVNTPVYADSGLTTPLPNPVPLNSRGEVSTAAGASSEMFLTPNSVYSMTLSDANGNQIWVASYVTGTTLTGLQIAALTSTVTTAPVLASYAQTGAELAAGVTPVQYQYPELHMFRYLTSAQITDVQTGANTLDCATAINNANAVAAKYAVGGEVYFPDGVYRTLSNISIPNGVSWRGTSYPQTNSAGTAWNAGAVIYKAHGAAGVSVVSSNDASTITRIGIWSNNTTWTTGNGFVIGPAFGCILKECTVREVGGDSFVIGDNTANSYTNCCEDCYSNNPGGRGFVIAGFYFHGRKIITDGGTIGLEATSQGSHGQLSEAHFEGFTVSGLKFDGVAGWATYGLIETVAYATGLVHVNVGAGTTDVRLDNLEIGCPTTDTTSVGVQFNATATYNVVNDGYFNYCGTGVLDGGNYNSVQGSTFFACTLAYNANGDLYDFTRNRCINSPAAATYNIAHNSGTRGRWVGNILDKSINPAVTLHAGNFSGIKCRDNIGYVTRNTGTSALIASGTAIAHGLAGTPLQDAGSGILFSCNTAGIPFPNVAATSSTTFTLDWTGGASAQWNWAAFLPCDP